MPHASSAGTKIYYEAHGEGPAVVFVHGSGGNHAAWWQQTAYFRPNYKVIALDLRGFGNSDPVPEGPDSQDFPDDIIAVLDHAGVERAVLVGQSIGASAALQAAMRNPARAAAVVLAHSVGGMRHPDVGALVRADRAEAEKLSVLDRLLTRHFQQGDPAKTFLFSQLGTFNQAKMQDLRNLNSGGPSIDEVKQAGIKVYFLAGENDAVIRPSTIAKAHALLDGSSMLVVPNGPHSMYWEAPALFNMAVHMFLRDVYGDDRKDRVA